MSNVPLWAQAAFWGFVSGVPLLFGAWMGFHMHVPRRVTAGVMAFGAGVLISALAFDLMDEAYRSAGFLPTATGFVAGALVYTAANSLLARRGAHHRKRSGRQQASEREAPGSGTAIMVGALLDGIPESIAIGVSLIAGGAVSVAAVVAVFLSNLPEGLSAAVGMKKAGRSRGYVLGLHAGILVASALAAMVGFALFSHFPRSITAGTTGVAAGGILAMLSSTMMPEAYEEAGPLTGIITVIGFLAAFALTKLDR